MPSCMASICSRICTLGHSVGPLVHCYIDSNFHWLWIQSLKFFVALGTRVYLRNKLYNIPLVLAAL